MLATGCQKLGRLNRKLSQVLCQVDKDRKIHLGINGLIRPNKKICVFRVTGLKILGRVGTHIFLIIFSGKNIILCILKGI